MRDPGPCRLPGTSNTLKSQAGGTHASLQGFRAQLAKEQGAEWEEQEEDKTGMVWTGRQRRRWAGQDHPEAATTQASRQMGRGAASVPESLLALV